MLKTHASAIVLVVLSSSALCAPSAGPVAAPDSVGLYEKFEATFNITTSATKLYWPHDVSPNPGVPAGVGVSVDGLFSADNWQTTVVQPGFYYQDFTYYPGDPDRRISNGDVWIHPVGYPVWKVRFAPTQLGTWKYKIRVVDSTGTYTGPEGTFTCIESANHGFVRVASRDGRYFELSDGTYLPLIGLNGVGTEDCAQLSGMGVNLMRMWWQSSNPQLALFGAGGQGGDLNLGNLSYTTDHVRPGHLVSSRIPNLGAAWTSVWLGINTTVAAKPNTDYRFTCVVKTVGLTGTGEHGVFVGEHPSLNRTTPINGDNDWREISVDFNSGDRTEVRVYVAEMNVTGGESYLSDMSLKEKLPNGQLGAEMLPRPDLQAHSSYSSAIAWKIDQLMDAAAHHNLYVRPVIEEKDDSFFGCIQADGTWGNQTCANIYASDAHACRTYQQYYWRYLIARYGYSTALHSVEFCNEGDPFNTYHYQAAAALGAYFAEHDPNHHLAGSSNWHSFPPRMWRNPDIGTADLHMYIGNRIASGGNRIWPGWHGSWTIANIATTPGDGFEFDSATVHSGSRSLKMTIPGVPGDDGNRFTTAETWFHCGARPGHNYRVSLWVKGENLKTYNKPWLNPGGLALQYAEGGNDFAGYTSGEGSCSAPWGTFDWQRLEYTFAVPSTALPGSDGRLPFVLWVRPYYRATNSSSPGYLWIDDVLIEDVSSGEVLNYNGSFEYLEPEGYDVVGGHCSYSRLVRSYGLGKPVIRGEVGVCYPQRFGSPYKTIPYFGNESQPGEDQLLVDDTEGIWWRKWVWAHIDSGGLTEMYWWSKLPLSRDYRHGKAFQNLMSHVPLSNGNYKEVEAIVSNPSIRVLGQKDLVNNQAHMWIDNLRYTWKAVVDHNFRPEAWNSSATYGIDCTCGYGNPVRQYRSKKTGNVNHPVTDTDWWEDLGTFNPASNPPLPPPVSGTVTITGLADGVYTVEWWDTVAGGVVESKQIQCANSRIELTVQNLVSDTACRLFPAPPNVELHVVTPSDKVAPNEVVTITVECTNLGQLEARNVEVGTEVPAQMIYVDGSAEATGGVYDSAANRVTWIVPVIPGGGTASRSFRAKVR